MKLTTAVQKGLLSIVLILGSLVLLIIALWEIRYWGENIAFIFAATSWKCLVLFY